MVAPTVLMWLILNDKHVGVCLRAASLALLGKWGASLADGVKDALNEAWFGTYGMAARRQSLYQPPGPRQKYPRRFW